MRVSSDLRRTCKIINAVVLRGSCISFANRCGIDADKAHHSRHKVIYIHCKAAYISLRIGYSDLAGAPQPQSSTPQANGRLKSPSRACSRALVSERRILRRSRFGASEVRDVAPGAHRGNREDAGRRTFRRIAADVLSGRSGLCARGAERTASQASRSQGRAQAYERSDAVYRPPHHRGRSSRRPSARSTDRDRTGCVGPPSQHRTRSGAQKKTIVPSNCLPPAAVSVYETLRGEVLRGVARPDGLGAVIYHGMLEGLALLMSVTVSTTTHQPMLPQPSVRGDRGLVSLLANMVLHTHLEVKHVC